MAKVRNGELNSNSQGEGRILALEGKASSKFFLVVAELISFVSLFLPWFTIRMSAPMMGIQMRGNYDFFLFNRMRISIEGLPGAFAGAVASEETMLINIHPFLVPLSMGSCWIVASNQSIQEEAILQANSCFFGFYKFNSS